MWSNFDRKVRTQGKLLPTCLFNVLNTVLDITKAMPENSILEKKCNFKIIKHY